MQIISTSEYVQSITVAETCYRWNNYDKVAVSKDCDIIDVDCAGNIIITKCEKYKFDIRDRVVNKSKLIKLLEDKIVAYYDLYGQYINSNQIKNEKLTAIINFRKEVENGCKSNILQRMWSNII